MNEEQARQFIRALFHFVWEKRDKSKIPTFYAANLSGFVDQLPVGIRDIYNGVDYVARNLSSNTYSIHDLVVSGDKIATVVNVKSVSADGEVERYTSNAFFFEMYKGKIRKMRMYIGESQETSLVEEEQPEEGESSLFTKAVGAVSKLAKNKAQGHQGAELHAEDEVPPPPPPEPPKAKPEAEKKPAPKKKVVTKKKPVAKKEVVEPVEPDEPGEVDNPQADYSASPAPKFSFNKAKLQVGVTPKDSKSKK